MLNVIMLSATFFIVMLNAIMLSVVVLCVVMLSAVAPTFCEFRYIIWACW